MAKQKTVPRPLRRNEYLIVFHTTQAEKGWQDLAATTRNALATAWEELTANPIRNDKTCHPLKGPLAEIMRAGQTYTQRQYELPGGARLWYYVTEGPPKTVNLVNVHTHHPNATK